MPFKSMNKNNLGYILVSYFLTGTFGHLLSSKTCRVFFCKIQSHSRKERPHKPANTIIVNATSTDAYRHSFFPRSIRSWNELTPSTISQDHPMKFKHALSTDPLFSSRY